MKIVLNELDKAHQQTIFLSGSLKLDSPEHYDISSLSHFQFTGQVHQEAGLVTVQGTISGLVKTKCSKCLQPVDYPLTVSFAESFAEGKVAEDSEIHSFSKGEIDLTPYFQEAVFLELPHVFVCDSDCKGLCPSCGINRNEAQCTCSQERIDPRLANLALFFQKEEK